MKKYFPNYSQRAVVAEQNFTKPIIEQWALDGEPQPGSKSWILVWRSWAFYFLFISSDSRTVHRCSDSLGRSHKKQLKYQVKWDIIFPAVRKINNHRLGCLFYEDNLTFVEKPYQTQIINQASSILHKTCPEGSLTKCFESTTCRNTFCSLRKKHAIRIMFIFQT